MAEILQKTIKEAKDMISNVSIRIKENYIERNFQINRSVCLRILQCNQKSYMAFHSGSIQRRPPAPPSQNSMTFCTFDHIFINCVNTKFELSLFYKCSSSVGRVIYSGVWQFCVKLKKFGPAFKPLSFFNNWNIEYSNRYK